MLGVVLRPLHTVPNLTFTDTLGGNHIINLILQLMKLRCREVKSGTITKLKKLWNKILLEAPGWNWPPGFLLGPQPENLF